MSKPPRSSVMAAGQAPGVVKVRLSGDEDDINIVAGLLASVTIDRSKPYLNREDPGVRVYLTLQVGGAR